MKSLGTEDRCPKNPVPAREEIFEYIVFRGHDIADLHVSEGPKNASPQQQQQQMSDPAIAHVRFILIEYVMFQINQLEKYNIIYFYTDDIEFLILYISNSF